MKEFKSIITHPEGQNLFPGQITGIEGYPYGTAVTMQNTKPQIALTSYGASKMDPNMDYKFLSNTVFELPMAQMGGQGQEEQLMQMIQIYAQMKGMKPEELIQKIQSLPKEQQQQAVQSIAQEVQQAMAQQQQAQQQAAMGQQGQEEMMGQEEMPMAQDGKQTGTSFWDKVVNQYNKTMDQAEDAVDQLTPYLLHQSIYGKSPKPINWKKVGNDIGIGINKFIKTSPIGVMINTPIPGLDQYSSQEQQLEEGGEPCFGCFDHYNPSPQAQDLNWFYKKQGGPFSAANTYPEDWASYSGNQYKGGGEAFPAAVRLQDWFGGDRSFMFAEGGESDQYGGQSDIDAIYNVMKKGGINYNPKKKKGGKFNHAEEFQKYLEKGGGLKKYQAANSITDNNKFGTRLTNGTTVDYNGDLALYDPNDMWYGDAPKDTFYDLNNQSTMFNGSELMAPYNDWNKQIASGTSTPAGVSNPISVNIPSSTPAAQNDNDQTPFATPSMMANTAPIQTPPIVAPDPYSKSAQKRAAVNSYVNTGALPQGKDASQPYNPYTNPTNYTPTYNTEPKGGGGTDISNYVPITSDKKEKKPIDPYIRDKRTRDLNTMAVLTGNKGLFGALAAVNNIGNAVGDAAAGWSHPGRAFKNTYATGGELDKYQAWMSQTNNNWQHSDTPMSTFALPQSMRYNSAFDNYLKSHPMASRDAFDASNTTTNTQGQDYSFNPGSTADPNYAKFSTEGKFDEPVYTPTASEKKEDKGWNFDFRRAEQDVAGLDLTAQYISNYKQNNNPNKDFQRRNTKTSEFMNVAQVGGGQYGDWSTNATQGTSFRPDEMVYAQKMGRPYKDINAYDYPEYMFKSGGSILDNYDEDGEYDLTEEEIKQILAAGGTIEYL